MSWLPAGFEHPLHVVLTSGHHLRPLRESDFEIDYAAVMGSRERLWSIYGEAWSWPPETLTFEQDRADLARHARETVAHETFAYAVLDEDETELVGCLYADPPEAPDEDAVVSWWVVDTMVGSPLDRALPDFVPLWLAETWGLSAPRFDASQTRDPS